MIEFLLRARSKGVFENLMKKEGWMREDGSLHPEAMCDPSPDSAEYPYGIPIPEPAVSGPPAVPPYHVNVRITGELEAKQIEGWPQEDANGVLLPQWQRTELGNAVARNGVPWTASNGTTKGMEFGNIVYLYIDSVKSRTRVWQ